MKESGRSSFRDSAVAAVAVVMLAGCETSVSTSDGRRMPPAPRAAKPVPDTLSPDRMVLLHAQKAVDTDGNGFSDQIEVLCSLFAEGYNTSIEWDGDFAFELFRMGDAHKEGATPIGQWRYEAESLDEHLTSASYGPCYRFNLSLIEAGGERVRAQHGDLRGRFEPVGEGKIVGASDQVRPVQIGAAIDR